MSHNILDGHSSKFKGFNNINEELDEINWKDRFKLLKADTIGWNKMVFDFEDKGELLKNWTFEIPKAMLWYKFDADSNKAWTTTNSNIVKIDKFGNIYLLNDLNHVIFIFNKNGERIGQIGDYGIADSTDGNSKLYSPHGIAFNYTDNEIFVSCSYQANARIKVLDYDTKEFKRSIGLNGTNGMGQFPCGLFYDEINDELYVAGEGEDRIHVLNKNGTYVRQLGTGTDGSADGQINGVYDVYYDSVNDDLYISDRINNRIQVWDSQGNFKRKWGTSTEGYFNTTNTTSIDVDVTNNRVVVGGFIAGPLVYDRQGNFLARIGRDITGQYSGGTGMGQWNHCTGVCFNENGTAIYAVDRNNGANNKVQKIMIDPNDNHYWYEESKSPALSTIFHDAFWEDTDKELYVVDYDNHLVRVYDKDFTPLRTIGTGVAGMSDGDIYSPSCVFVNKEDDEVYVGTTGTTGTFDGVHVFNCAGTFQRRFVSSISNGSGDNDFYDIRSVFYDKTYKEFYIVDQLNHRIKVHDKNGVFKRKWGSNTTTYEQGKFNQPFGILVYKNEVYVSDALGRRIQVFDRLGTFKREFYVGGGTAETPNTSMEPRHLEIFDDKLYVAIRAQAKFEIYDPSTGEFINKFGGTTSTGDAKEYLVEPHRAVYNPTDEELYVINSSTLSTINVFKRCPFGLKNTHFNNNSLLDYKFNKDRKRIGLFPEKDIDQDNPEIWTLYKHSQFWHQLIKVINRKGEMELLFYRHPLEVFETNPVEVSNGYKITLPKAKARRFKVGSKVKLMNQNGTTGYHKLRKIGNSLVTEIVEILDDYNIVVKNVPETLDATASEARIGQIIDENWEPLNDEGQNIYLKWEFLPFAFRLWQDDYGNEIIADNPYFRDGKVFQQYQITHSNLIGYGGNYQNYTAGSIVGAYDRIFDFVDVYPINTRQTKIFSNSSVAGSSQCVYSISPIFDFEKLYKFEHLEPFFNYHYVAGLVHHSQKPIPNGIGALMNLHQNSTASGGFVVQVEYFEL